LRKLGELLGADHERHFTGLRAALRRPRAFQENYDSNGVPVFNTDHAVTLASIDRFKKIAANLKATVIIQHDARDVGKLPVFPAAAK
jgi:hypothetical protein